MENYKIKMMNNSIYHYPTINLLDSASAIAQDVDLEQLEEQQKHIIDVLRTFCIPINEIKYTLSPSAIRYEIKPKSGQLYAKVRKNEHDISLCLSPMGVRIMSPVPGRNVMVIEIANPAPYTYQLKDIIEATTLKNDDMDLPCAIGKTIDDEVFMFDLAKMPHMLIAGRTGSGKSVFVQSIIMSIVFIGIIIGIPPAIAASYNITLLCSSAKLNSSSPCFARSSLFAVTMCLPFAIAVFIKSYAGSIPPINSATISTSEFTTS